MTLKELRYVTAVRDHQSISKAAASLYISQPALSTYIKNLEDTLNVKLFQNVNNRIIPTHNGELYCDASRHILSMYDRMSRDLLITDNMISGKLRIGITAFRSSYLLPKVLPDFHNAYPNVEIQLVEENASALEESLANGTIDIAVIKQPFSTANIGNIKLFEEELLLSVPKGHPVTGKAERRDGEKYSWLDLRLLENEYFILLRLGQRTRQIVEQIMQRAPFRPKHFIETSSIDTALRLSAAGLGISFIPEFYAISSYHTDLPEFFSFGEPKTISSFHVVYPKNGPTTKHADYFVGLVTAYYGVNSARPARAARPDTPGKQ